MEHVFCHAIMKHLELHHILNEFQYGFRPGHSCQAQLISIVEEIQYALDQHHQADLIMLDFSKAFDTVPHNRLLHKLKFYGIREKAHEWLSIWLTQRIQRVVLDGQSSSYVNVASGVPQGTVLGPILFLLYINDISTVINSSIRLFADDCVLYRIFKSDLDHHQLQSDLDLILTWSHIWQMRFNTNKCVTLRCHRSFNPRSFIYHLGGQPLTCVNEHKYLGILLTSSMSFSSHINNISILCIESYPTKSFQMLKRNKKYSLS